MTIPLEIQPRSENLTTFLVSAQYLPFYVADAVVAWMDDGPSYDDAQDDDEDLRSDPIAHIDIGVSNLQSCVLAGGALGEAFGQCSTTDASVGIHHTYLAPVLREQRQRDAPDDRGLDRRGEGDLAGCFDFMTSFEHE